MQLHAGAELQLVGVHLCIEMLEHDQPASFELFCNSNCSCISVAVPAFTLSAGVQQQTYWQANMLCIIAGNHWLECYVQVVVTLTAFALTYYLHIGLRQTSSLWRKRMRPSD